MLHLPVNHHLRPLYRTLAGLAGLYVLVFGVLGSVRSRGLDFFAQPKSGAHLPWVLGLRTNPAFALLSIVVGLVIVLAAIVDRNVDYYVNIAAGSVFLLAGMAMMTLLQTDFNFLGFSMANCIASFILGTVVFIAGLYGRAGSTDRAHEEEAVRHGEVVAH
jgi:hypothetical protein